VLLFVLSHIGGEMKRNGERVDEKRGKREALSNSHLFKSLFIRPMARAREKEKVWEKRIKGGKGEKKKKGGTIRDCISVIHILRATDEEENDRGRKAGIKERGGKKKELHLDHHPFHSRLISRRIS